MDKILNFSVEKSDTMVVIHLEIEKDRFDKTFGPLIAKFFASQSPAFSETLGRDQETRESSSKVEQDKPTG